MHPTVKPVALIADAMRDCSKRGPGFILDTFAGSGSTIMAAEQIGRRAFCMEIDPQYVDVAVRRWQQFTRRDAILESTGQAFDELLAARDDNHADSRAPNPAPGKEAGAAAQLTALMAFIDFTRRLYNIPLAQIFTHGELGQTDCPGKILQAFMDRTRTHWAAIEGIAWQPATRPAGTQASSGAGAL